MSRMVDYSRYEHLLIDRDPARRVLGIRLNNPGKRNAISPEMGEELEYIFDDAWADSEIDVILLSGEGDSFCAGADTGNLAEQSGKGRPGRPPSRGARRIFFSMLDCEKPIVAKVRGPAYGLGVNLAVAADVVYVSDTARLCDSHVRVGLAPGDGGAVLWPLLIGFHRAKEFLMTGEVITGPRAAELGLVNRCVPDADLDAVTDELVEKLVNGSPLAIAYAKSSVNVMLKQMMTGAFETSLAYDLLTLKTRDHEEGVRAHLERRPPRFTGA